MTTQKPEALRLADKYEAEGFLQDHRFAQNHWCMQAAVELRRLHARIAELEAQLEAIGAGGVEPLRKAGDYVRLSDVIARLEQACGAGSVPVTTLQYHFRDATEMVPVGWAISYDGKNPHALWTAGDGDLLDLEVKRQGGTACKMALYAAPQPPTVKDSLTDHLRGATKMMQAALTITSDRPPNKQGDEEWKQNTHRAVVCRNTGWAKA